MAIRWAWCKHIDYDYANPTISWRRWPRPTATLPKGTHAEITSDLLGNVQLQLRFGSDFTSLLTPGDTISGQMQQGMMSKASAMLPQVEQMLPKLDSILSSVNTLLADPALAGTVTPCRGLTASLTTTTRQLNQLTAQLNREMPKMMGKAEGVLANTEQLTGKLLPA